MKTKKDCKGVSKIFIVEFTRKYKQLFVEEHSNLPDVAACCSKILIFFLLLKWNYI